MLELSRKLQDSSRTVSRSVIGFTTERTCPQAAQVVLAQTPISTSSRDRLTAALGTEHAGALARRLILADYAQFLPLVTHRMAGSGPDRAVGMTPTNDDPVGFLSPFIINPVATANRLGAHRYELAALAEARELTKFSQRQQRHAESLVHEHSMKNGGGRLMLFGAEPSFDHIVEAYWKTVDLRREVRQRLSAAAPHPP